MHLLQPLPPCLTAVCPEHGEEQSWEASGKKHKADILQSVDPQFCPILQPPKTVDTRKCTETCSVREQLKITPVVKKPHNIFKMSEVSCRACESCCKYLTFNFTVIIRLQSFYYGFKFCLYRLLPSCALKSSFITVSELITFNFAPTMLD